MLPLSPLTLFSWSLPVCPYQQRWALTNHFHRRDSVSSSLRLFFPCIQKPRRVTSFGYRKVEIERFLLCVFKWRSTIEQPVWVHIYKLWLESPSIKTRSQARKLFFLVLKFWLINNKLYFFPQIGVWSWDKTGRTFWRHSKRFGKRCSWRRKLASFHLWSHQRWEDLHVFRSVPRCHTFTKQCTVKLKMTATVWKWEKVLFRLDTGNFFFRYSLKLYTTTLCRTDFLCLISVKCKLCFSLLRSQIVGNE